MWPDKADSTVLQYLPTEVVIMEFMHYYRDVFPEASITHKLHILEDHIVNFLWNWRVGCGLCEQGAESIHKVYNQLKAYNFILIFIKTKTSSLNHL